MARTDEDLAREAQRGEAAPFEELVRRHARPVYLAIYMETGDRTESEDLAQEAMLLAWRRLTQLREPERFGAWCRTIGRSVAVDAARRKGRLKRRAPERPDAPPSPTGPDEESSLRESKEGLLEAIRALPEEHRMPILLKYMDDLSYEEMAERLGLTHAELRGRLQRGMALLRGRLGATGTAGGGAGARLAERS
ncbi:MAG: sigma-70 family RNA polymerase sigma factor [Planctomycetes bacterium]|nr:sigma-70 family RNA polymerase sigma factor [Planctomycetota bacterium]